MPFTVSQVPGRVRSALARVTGRSPFSRVVLLAGSGRSGTTWIGNLINHRHDHAVLFEPIHHQRVPEFQAFQNRQYLRPGSHDERFAGPIRRLLQGRIANRWANAQNDNPFAERLLIKDIRANLLLKWLADAYPDVRVVLLIRHPYAVASSRMKLGWPPFTDALLAQPALMQDWLEPFRDLLERPGNEFLGNVTCWCAENYVPTRQFATGGLHVAFYEHFLLAPDAEVARLMRFLDATVPADVTAHLTERSHTNWNRQARTTPAFDDWKHDVRPEDDAQARLVLERFGLDAWYDADGRPTGPGATA